MKPVITLIITMGFLSTLFSCSKPSNSTGQDTVDVSYQFSAPKNTSCFTCTHVVRNGAEILNVTHDVDDGGWQFLCGSEHSMEDAMILCMEEVVLIDPSVNSLYEMPEGIGAVRDDVGGEWKPYKLP